VVLAIDWPAADVEDVAVNYLLFATAWLLGDSARSRRERAAQLEARAEEAERTRAAEAERAVVAERNRIAREMHDVLAHHVSIMVVQAEAGPVVVERDPGRAIAAFDAISATGKQALVEMRRLLGVLRDPGTGPSLAPQPGAADIPSLVEGVRAAGLPVRLTVEGEPAPLPPAVDLSAYRVMQEALTNALRHAPGRSARASVTYADAELRLRVMSDGTHRADRTDGAAAGPAAGPAALAPGGHGLTAMRERVVLLGGTLRAGPTDDGAWLVEAVLPVDGARPVDGVPA
jgi:signal transduction histidine kinase